MSDKFDKLAMVEESPPLSKHVNCNSYQPLTAAEHILSYSKPSQYMGTIETSVMLQYKIVYIFITIALLISAI